MATKINKPPELLKRPTKKKKTNIDSMLSINNPYKVKMYIQQLGLEKYHKEFHIAKEVQLELSEMGRHNNVLARKVIDGCLIILIHLNKTRLIKSMLDMSKDLFLEFKGVSSH